MALAINIRSDDSSAKRIEALWDEVAAFESQPSMRALGYQPHFTFAIYDAPEIAAKTAWEAMLRAVGDEGPLLVAFKRIRWFAGPPLVLWAEPEFDETLVRWHASISAAIDPAFVGCTIGPKTGDLIARSAHKSPTQSVMTRSPSRSHSTAASACCSTSSIALLFRLCVCLRNKDCRFALREPTSCSSMRPAAPGDESPCASSDHGILPLFCPTGQTRFRKNRNPLIPLVPSTVHGVVLRIFDGTLPASANSAVDCPELFSIVQGAEGWMVGAQGIEPWTSPV